MDPNRSGNQGQYFRVQRGLAFRLVQAAGPLENRSILCYRRRWLPALMVVRSNRGGVGPQRALYPFTGFYGFCLVLKGWQFARKRLAAGEAGSSPSTV